MGFLVDTLSFLGSWLMMILSGDMRSLRSAVLVVGIVFLLLKFIESVPQIYRTIFEGSSAGAATADPPPLLLIVVLILIPMPLLVGSCRAALDAVTRANRSRAKLAESREQWKKDAEEQ